MSYDVCEQAIQVHGGYGFCSEYPVEQFARDCKIASIYEGTNGIQAMDLLSRKILRDKGAGVKALMGEMVPVVERTKAHPVLGSYAATVEQSYAWLQDALKHVTAVVAGGEIPAGFLESVPLLEIFGDVLLGWFHLWQAEIALAKVEKVYEEAGAKTKEEQAGLVDKNPDAAYLEGKVATARFYIGRLLPIVAGKVEAIKKKETAPLEIPDAAF
jgi:hypothetical protein